MKKWGPLVILAAAQFIMVLDQAVMNVSISQLVKDLDTTVTAIQVVITLYSLVMAMFMVTGGKVGDLIGRRRAFIIGLVIYSVGSLITALSPSVGVLAFGWAFLEGVGAALVLPALAALLAGNYEGADRAVAYSVIGGVAGAGIAVGPLLGGWATTELSWRWVFVGEVVVNLAILLFIRLLRDAPLEGRKPRLDGVGAALSAAGLGLVVLGILQASTWGWLKPKSSPIEPLGFSLTPFVVAAGGVVLWAFVGWQHRREEAKQDPLVHLALFKIPPLRAGLQTFLAQNLILMGVFFVLPLYLQLVLGLDALDTGIRMLPVSVTMFAASMAGSALARRHPTRSLVRVGFLVNLVAILWLVGTIEPTLDESQFALAMALLGLGLGLIVSQLGNVVQSSVDASGRSEAGGLQYTAQQLGSALGVALIGAIVLSGLVSGFLTKIDEDDRVPQEVTEQAELQVTGKVSFLTADQVEAAALDQGVEPDVVDAVVEQYEEAQLLALKTGLFVTAMIALGALVVTKHLPTEVPGRTIQDIAVEETSACDEADGEDAVPGSSARGRLSRVSEAPRSATLPVVLVLIVVLLFVGLVAWSTSVSDDDTAASELCASYAAMVDAGDALEAKDLTTSTAGETVHLVDDYLDAVHGLMRTADGRYTQQLDALDQTVTDIERTLASVQVDADYSTWQPLVADDVEAALDAAAEVREVVGPSCTPPDL